jgi:hypothetical protein
VAVVERHVDVRVAGLRGAEVEVVRDRPGVEEPLAALVAAVRARTVVPEPDGVEGAAVTVGPGDLEPGSVELELHDKV